MANFLFWNLLLNDQFLQGLGLNGGGGGQPLAPATVELESGGVPTTVELEVATVPTAVELLE